MSFLQEYHDVMQKKMQQVFEINENEIEKGANCLLQTECNHGKIYTFGTGHSHMIGQELYARAGGFAKIYPILEIELTLTTHPTKSTHIERCASYADVLQELYHLQKGDTVIATSNSGRNALVIEYLMRLKKQGVHIIAITSLTHSKKIKSRHESNLRLFEIADVVLDNLAPYGDASTKISETVIMGPISTMTGCYLSQCLIGRFVELLTEHKMETPVFRSSNMDGADAYNQNLFDTFSNRTK